MFESRTRPCLQYQIKRCSAPCVGKISREGYATLVADAERFLEGKTTAVQADLAKAMAEASEAMEFERAAALRDRIKALTQVQQTQGINPQRRGRGGRGRAASGTRAGLRAGLLHPRQPKLGQPRFLPQDRRRAPRSPRSWRPSSPSSTTTRNRPG